MNLRSRTFRAELANLIFNGAEAAVEEDAWTDHTVLEGVDTLDFRQSDDYTMTIVVNGAEFVVTVKKKH